MEPKQKNPNWGGKRPGSGRKPTGVKRVVVYLLPEQIDYLFRKDYNVSGALRQIIQQAMEAS